MAYGTKYTFQWTDAAGVSCEVRVQQEGYTGSVTELVPGRTPFEITWGQQGQQDLTTPFMVSTARLRFKGNTAGESVKEVFDSGDTEYRVQYYEAGSLFWQGFLATDLWQSNPRTPADTIELEAVDGLALLENRGAYVQGDGAYVFTDASREVLRGLHSLPIHTSMDWRPYGASVPAGECPLDHLQVPDKAYQKLNDQGEVKENGSPTVAVDQRSQLEDICERFGLQLFQADGAWHLRQRDQVEDGTALKRWKMGTSATSFGSASTDDITASLPPQLARTEKPQQRVQRLRALRSVFTYDELGELAYNGSFEVGSGSLQGWSTGGPKAGASVIDYDNQSRVSVNATQEDRYAAKLEPGDTGLSGDYIKQVVEADIHDAGPDAALVVKLDLSQPENNEGDPTGYLDIAMDGQYYIQGRTLNVNGETDAAEDGVIEVKNPVPGATGEVVIPKGGFLLGPPSSSLAEIEVLETVRAGDEVLHVDLPVDLPDGATLSYNVWADKTRSWDPGRGYPEQEYDGQLIGSRVGGPRMLPVEYVVPLNTPDAVDLSESTLSIRIETMKLEMLVDDVSVELQIDGEPIEQTEYIALDEHYGREQTLEHRIGDGPTATHPRRVHQPGSFQLAEDWKAGPYADGESQSGKGLEQLLAESWMRQQRETLDRRTFEYTARGESIGPQYVYQHDGKTYTPTYIRRVSSSYGNAGRIEITEVKDAGTAGLQRAYSMSAGSTATGGGSAAPAARRSSAPRRWRALEAGASSRASPATS